MNRLLEFIQHHPWLISSAALLMIAAVVIELQHRKRSATAVSPADAVRLINSGALVIDIRSAEAFAAGHIIDARLVPEAELANQADSLKKYREKPVLLCCDTGAASATAATTLKGLGFTQVVTLGGGLAAWKQENLPLVSGHAPKGKTQGKLKAS